MTGVAVRVERGTSSPERAQGSLLTDRIRPWAAHRPRKRQTTSRMPRTDAFAALSRLSRFKLVYANFNSTLEFLPSSMRQSVKQIGGWDMRFAIINEGRHLPEKGLQGAICPVCEKPVIAKCGEVRQHHWAHTKGTECSDTWNRGKETDWHLAWKREFPDDWQERILTDSETGERHIADVLTEKNLVLEFQHSPIDPDERKAREAFYSKDGRNMIWIVDMTKSTRVLKKFSSQYFIQYLDKTRWNHLSWPEEIFPRQWIYCNVPVLFDFGMDLYVHDDNGEVFESLLITKHISRNNIVFTYILKKDLIKYTKIGNLYNYISTIKTIRHQTQCQRISLTPKQYAALKKCKGQGIDDFKKLHILNSSSHTKGRERANAAFSFAFRQCFAPWSKRRPSARGFHPQSLPLFIRRLAALFPSGHGVGCGFTGADCQGANGSRPAVLRSREAAWVRQSVLPLVDYRQNISYKSRKKFTSCVINKIFSATRRKIRSGYYDDF